MSPSLSLQPFRDLDRTSPQFHRQLSTLLDGNGCRSVISSLEGDDLAWLIEYLDNVIASISDPSSLESKEFLRELGRICSLINVLPKSCLLSDSLRDFCLLPAPEGTFNASRLRIKRIRIRPNEDQQKAKQAFHQLAVVWKHLNHQRIVPLLGVTIDPLQCVSDRMPGGHLSEYIVNHPDVNRPSLLSDVAEGLNYLHSCNVVHGDLNGSNILVDTAGHARITDFGLAVVTQDLRGILSEDGRGTWWIAPEILDNQGTYSKEADVFSFAGVTIEAFAGAAPFSEEPPRAATSAIIRGQRPPRPAHPDLTDCLWRLTQRCWDQEPHLRPCALRLSCGFDIPAWKCLIDRSLTPDERISLIADIFSDHDETKAAKCLHGDDAQSFVNIIDEMLNRLTPSLRRKCLSTLCKICGRQALLPRSVQIPICYNRMEVPLYCGGYAHVWEGEYRGRKVAVKVLTVSMTSNLDKITRMFCKEVITWKALRHQNVLPLLGVTMSRNQFAMVSEWMINGNINEFVEKHAEANRFELLKDVTRGLVYMHEEGMIHGDLKGANILIDQDGHACLADFGLTVIVSDPAFSTTSGSFATGGTARWMSPERHDPAQFGIKESRPTKESDCYELGMVILEVLSGQVPFTRDCTTFMAMGKVVGGERPERPQGAEGMWFTDNLWGMLQVCWSHQPNDRPTVEDVLQRLEGVSTVWQPPPCVEMNIDEPSLAVSSPVLGPQILPSLSPRLSVDPSTTGSLARGFDTIAAGSAATDGPYPPPRLTPPPPFDELDIEGSGETIIGAPLEERTYAEIDENGVGQLVPANIKENEFSSQVKEDSDITMLDQRLDELDRRSTELPNPTPTFRHPPPPTAAPHNTTYELIYHLGRGNVPQNEIPQVLSTIFDSRDYKDIIVRLPGNELEMWVERLDQIIDSTIYPEELRKITLCSLVQTCGLRRILPRSHYFHGRLHKASNRPMSGGTADVWRVEDERRQVYAAKAFRVNSNGEGYKIKKYFREVTVWKRLNHPNIVPNLGAVSDVAQFCVVSPWVPDGDLLQYLGKNPGANRVAIMIGVADGLSYLHSRNVIHGGLKGMDILFDSTGVPQITDFKIASIDCNPTSNVAPTPSYSFCLRWAAPEMLEGRNWDGYATKMSDVYAFAMVVVEIFTGNFPFPDLPDFRVQLAVMKGKRPPKPADASRLGLSSTAWKLVQDCWHKKRDRRPDMQYVASRLRSSW